MSTIALWIVVYLFFLAALLVFNYGCGRLNRMERQEAMDKTHENS